MDSLNGSYLTSSSSLLSTRSLTSNSNNNNNINHSTSTSYASSSSSGLFYQESKRNFLLANHQDIANTSTALCYLDLSTNPNVLLIDDSKPAKTSRAKMTKSTFNLKKTNSKLLNSFKSKLKSKIFSKTSKHPNGGKVLLESSTLSTSSCSKANLKKSDRQLFLQTINENNNNNRNNVVEWSFSLFNEPTPEPIEKEEIKNIVGVIHKLMDKSLGWLRIRSKSSKQNKNRSSKRGKNAQVMVAPAYVMEEGQYYDGMNNYEDEYLEYGSQVTVETDDYLRSRRSDDCDDFTALRTKSRLLNAPSMCSSFDRTKSRYDSAAPTAYPNDQLQHSTPCSLSQKFSPISKTTNESYSTLDIVSFATPSMSRRRLSFGATSSPVPSVDSQQQQHHQQQNEPAEMSVSRLELDDSARNTSYVIYQEEMKYLEHIDNVKKNIRIGYEARNMKRNFYEANEQSLTEDVSHMHKRRKLQKIFQLKLKKQLREIRKWQNGIRNEFNVDDNLSFRKVKRHTHGQKNKFMCELSYCECHGDGELYHSGRLVFGKNCSCTDCECNYGYVNRNAAVFAYVNQRR